MEEERERMMNATLDDMLRQGIEEEIERRNEKRAERESGVHFILQRLGFTFSTFKSNATVYESAVVLGSTIHNELGYVARSQNTVVKETYTQFTIATLIRLKELGIILDGTNVDVWDNNELFKFRTKIDLTGYIMRDRRKIKVIIELKTTTTSVHDAENQLDHVTGRNQFPDGHPLAKNFKLINSMTKALTQLFLMYRNYRFKSPDCIPILIYVFSDDVRIYPFFTLLPELQTEFYKVHSPGGEETIGSIDHVENLYREVVFWYAKKYSTQLLMPADVAIHRELLEQKI